MDKGSITLLLKNCGVRLLPNTSGVRDAKEAVCGADGTPEALNTNWLRIKRFILSILCLTRSKH